MSHTARLMAHRSASSTHVRAAMSKQAKQQEEELHHAIQTLRGDLRHWDSSSRQLRKSILERFLWLHSTEGAGIGAARENDWMGSTLVDSDAAEKHIEQKEMITSPSTMLLHGLAVPNSLANASLESLYGAGASLLLMRITSWLRLTYTLRVANLLNLRAIATFCADASGGLRFVHEFVEAGGILTLLSIIEAVGPAEKSDPYDRIEEMMQQQKLSSSSHGTQSQSRLSHSSTAGSGNAHIDHTSSTAALQRAASLASHLAAQEASEIEKERALSILKRIATTGRAFKEMICEQKGVTVVINCLARVRREQTQEIAKQLLCQLGMGNPRYASLVHEELLSVFRAPSSNSCKRMVLQTLHFLLSHTATAHDLAKQSNDPSLSASSAALTAAIEYDVHGNPIDQFFSADARYVEATVSLYHIHDANLHYEANQLLKLLITKHGLQESTLQALLSILKQKTQNTLNSPSSQPQRDPTSSDSSSSSSSSQVSSRRNSRMEGASSKLTEVDQGSVGFNSAQEADRGMNGTGANGQGNSGGSDRSSAKHLRDRTGGGKQSDPKILAIKMLNELALMSYELCLRMTQLGVVHLLLDCLCNMQNYELQHSACGLLYTLNNNVVESASLIRYMMSGTTSQAAISMTAATSEGLYLEFLKNPDHLHRHLSYADVKKIQQNLRNPPTQQTSLLSQRRLERRSTGMGVAGLGGAGSGTRKNSVTSSPGLTGAGVLASPQGPKRGKPGDAPAQSSRSRKSSGTNFSFQMADPSAHQAHFDAAAASATASTSNSPSKSGTTASTTSPSLQPFGFAPPSSLLRNSGDAQSLEAEDAAFFAAGLRGVARQSETDLIQQAVRAERQHEKEKLAIEQAVREAQSKREEEKSDATATTTDEAGATDQPTDPSSQTDVVAALQLAARKKLENLALGRAHQSHPSISHHPDQIGVPALELYFDPKLRLVDEGQPHVPHSKTLQLLYAGSAVSAGVHEGSSLLNLASSVSSDSKGGPSSDTRDSGVYTPFAQQAEAKKDREKTDGEREGKDGKATSSASSGGGDHLIFSQRVGLPVSREVKSDGHSDAYLSVHFKDLMQPNRAAFLSHGQPSVAEQLARSSSSSHDPSKRPRTQQGLNDMDDSQASTSSYLLPDILPSVEILSDLDSLLTSASKKTAEARQEELKRKRDEKRAKDAAVMAQRSE